MIKILIKKQLTEIFRGYFVNRKTGKVRTKGSTLFSLGLLAFLFISLGFAFYGMSSGLGAYALGHGYNWIYFALLGLIAIALGVFGSVFNTFASLYTPKDNELLFSLPIPPEKLLAARISGVFITSFMYSAWVWIPVIIAYFVLVPLNFLNVLFPIVLTFVLALFVTVLSCILGFFVAIIAKKTKNKNILKVLFSLCFIGLYYVIYFKVINSLKEVVKNLGKLRVSVKSWLHYMYFLGRAADGDVISMLIVLGITAALFAVCFYVLSKTLFNLSSGSETGTAKRSKAKAGYSVRTPEKALLFREYKHFASVPTWMLNGGFGLLIMVAAAVVLIVKQAAIRKAFAEINLVFAGVPVVFAAVICLFISSVTVLPVSVSIEGKTLWLLKSLPVSSKQVISAKERMGIGMTVLPALLVAAVGCAVLDISLVNSVIICIITLLCVCLSNDFGLFLNLKNTDFNWTNAATLTKQSMPVMINLFGGWGFCAGIGLGGFFLCNYIDTVWVLLIIAVLFAALLYILHRYLNTKGTKIFEEL